MKQAQTEIAMTIALAALYYECMENGSMIHESN